MRWPARASPVEARGLALMEHGTAWRREGVGRVGGGSSMDPGRDGAPSDADPPVVPAAADDFDVRDLDRELERLLADQVPIGVTIGAASDRNERLERLVGGWAHQSPTQSPTLTLTLTLTRRTNSSLSFALG